MLFLLCRVGEDRYAINMGEIVEVLPMVALKQIPQAPPGIAGALNYRGTVVPVIDLTDLTLGRPASVRLSTRLIVLNSVDGKGGKHLLGLIAEHATDTMRRNPMDFAPGGIANENTPYLGPVATDDRGIVQWIDPASLVPPAVRTMLFDGASDV
jgi:chemotaxis-related protein WspB